MCIIEVIAMFTPAPLFPGARVALLCTSSAVSYTHLTLPTKLEV